MVNDDRSLVCSYLADGFLQPQRRCEQVYDSAPRNVRTTLVRQLKNARWPHPDRPVSSFRHETAFMQALGRLPLECSILTLARLYDEVHVYLCRALDRSRKGRPHNAGFLKNPWVELRALADELVARESAVEDQIYLQSEGPHPQALRASWRRILPMTFDNLPVLKSLGNLLPGERSESHEYAGIGGGGGSDIISTSMVGHLLRQQGKEMDLLISTRTWAIGSQGKAGAKVGTKREVYNSDTVNQANGTPIPGTYRVKEHTHAEGRDLEAIPWARHSQIYMVLDQGESRSSIPKAEQTNLPGQFEAILSQSKRDIDTVMTIDTGGDVFGVDIDCGTTATPDQDYRVQKAVSTLSSSYNLVTCVVAPGVDAPSCSPLVAERAGGMVYHLSQEEKKRVLELLVEYRMDGSVPNRFGKTSLALQARLKGKLGWVSLDLPEYVVDTWENPWNSFVYVRKCMEDLVLLPTMKLVHELDNRMLGETDQQTTGRPLDVLTERLDLKKNTIAITSDKRPTNRLGNDSSTVAACSEITSL
ncbi:hypothetical protein DV735_g5796, partial [Chaetothyriales sp. CBS 134920]